MYDLDKLSFSFHSKLSVILQTEATECGLACLAMLADYHGYESDLATLRQRFPVSAKGSTLTHLLNISHQLNFVSRPLKLELGDLDQLKKPCILHWDFNHFVVLERVSKNKIIIVDPAFGRKQLSLKEASLHFTGVALEVWPNLDFEERKDKQEIKIHNLLGHVKGIWKSLGQILVLALVLEIFALTSPFFMQWVIDHVIVSADSDLLTILALGFGLLMVLQQVISLLRSWFVLFMSTHLNIQWRGNVFSHLMHVPVAYYERRSLGDIVSRFGSIDRIQQTLTTTFLEAILDGMMTTFTIILMFIYSPKLAVIALITMCLYGLIRWIWYAPLRRSTEAQIIHAAKQSSHFMETIRGAKTIKLFQRQDIRRSTWLGLLVNQVNADLVTQKLGLMFRLANGILFGVENILIIWFGATLILEGQFTVGALMAFMAYKNQFDGRIAGLIDKYIQLKMLQIDAERLADIVLTQPEKLHGERIEQENDSAQPIIQVKNLTFQYSETDPVILNEINFSIPRNQSVVIVGPTGCGKTTLMHLLLGVHSVSSGEIQMLGKSIDKLGLNDLRNQIGTVLQDDILFAGSIAENICFFDPYPDQAWVESCAQLASVHEDILRMPMAYHTLVGELGSMLSGGQKQRILLARALYKKPKILFMDEATSNLDLQKEREVNRNIKAMNITRIFIAHRPETIATADRMIALQEGVIVQDILLEQKKCAE
ncbi:peptidase domain-containing ABC transporter [Acinetobacter genomosp. 15BJ]|uniref:ATP-binding cassette, subfamily B, bacterial RaxB n=1 Tax=Acinetobacter genomosp. 15BJ TaxID=106651 RepID=R9AZ24_9GAMM|nr:peptidase domain-containing ABC transporter [Acinetobacter genomosp. 15BJ]EOR07448.1 ATP-binding cassette, subfamily B, bacterial RaxB [Acinetobacter genomosp. 15BJ]MCH7291478.1 peptidase domain-containing ABC transporter [Acinetobacter genomosp. 15BJ]MDO3657884.1 peptidase domain-containing ABC transporter [Acinetobacter genomosp. 15BJ]